MAAKKKQADRVNKRFRLSVRYIDETLVLSETHAWTFVKLPVVPYEFQDEKEREAIVARFVLAVSGMVTGVEPVDCQMILTNRPVNVDVWARQFYEKAQAWQPAPGFTDFLLGQVDHLKDQDFLRKEVYFGVCLGRRGPGATAGDQGWFEWFTNAFKKPTEKIEQKLEYEDDVVTEAELKHWRSKANDIQRRLRNSRLQARPAPPSAIAWLVSKPFWPDMVCPPPTSSPSRVWGPGEIETLAEGIITNGHRYLRVDQVDEDGLEQTGYSCTLALSRFPDVLEFPAQEPWMHIAASLAFPVEISTRFQIVPVMKVKQDIGRKLLEAKDQGKHTSEATGGVPLELQEQLAAAEVLEYTLTKDNTPFAYGWHRISVAAPDPVELMARVRAIIDLYRDLHIDVVLPTGDQFNLFLEQMPGDKPRLKSYFQRHELPLIGGGMPTASAEVGDVMDGARGWIGPYIGETTSRVRTDVHFSPHVAPVRNFPPGIAITGAPGGGKSFLAFTLAYQMAVSGVWVIYIDPKADAKPMGELEGLGAPKVFDLRAGHAGMLDPFSLGETNAEATLLAIESMRLLLGGELSDEREALLLAAIETTAKSNAPSMMRVVDTLLSWNEPAAQSLGQVLRMMSELPFAKLCFAPSGGHVIRPEDGLTVITLLGLELPSSAAETKDYTYENKLAVTVMYLLTRYARRLMLHSDKAHPKAICIDEAWAITSTPQGAKLIPEIARMGRSHNTVLVLVSQNAGDLMEEAVTNSISTIFAFRSKNPNEIDNILEFLSIDKHEGHRAAIRELRNGECLMKDIDGRIQRVQISDYDPVLFSAFDTNPETRGKGAPGTHQEEGAA